MRALGVGITVFLVLACIATAIGLTAAAEPGSKDDPLATVGYVSRYAQFSREEFPAGRSIRLGKAAEIIIVDAFNPVYTTSEFDPLRDQLIDLTTGAAAASRELGAQHHYINGSNHDIFLKFDRESVVLVRGEWK